MTQNNEEVQTDLLLMTNNSAQGIPSEKPQSMSNTIENTGVSEEFPSLVSITLRIYFSKNMSKKLQTRIDLHYSFQKQILLQEK